jgi:serine/threonine protein kinase
MPAAGAKRSVTVASPPSNGSGGFECAICHEPIVGDTHFIVRHIVACRANRLNGGSAQPAPTRQQPDAHDHHGARISVFAGASTVKRDFVAEELAMLNAMYSDTLSVLHEEDGTRLPAIAVDVSAQVTNPVGDDVDARVFLTIEYTVGYPLVPPNIDLTEPYKGCLRSSAMLHVRRTIEKAVVDGLAIQEPFVMPIIAAVQEALSQLVIANSEALSGGACKVHAEFDVADDSTGPDSDRPLRPGQSTSGASASNMIGSPNNSLVTAASPIVAGTAPSPGWTRSGTPAQQAAAPGSQQASNIATPHHVPSRAQPQGAGAQALLASLPGLGPSLADVHLQRADAKKMIALELFAMHLLRRLCVSESGGALPPNAFDTLRVYLQDLGLVFDAKAESSYRLLRRHFRSSIEAAKDPLLAWLWSPSHDNNDAAASLTSTTVLASSDLSNTQRFRREFVSMKTLGAGAFGSVHECIRQIDRRKYAVKKVVMRRVKQDLVLREVRTLAALDHPNIVHYYDCWVEAGKQGEIVESTSDEDESSDEIMEHSDGDDSHAGAAAGMRNGSSARQRTDSTQQSSVAFADVTREYGGSDSVKASKRPKQQQQRAPSKQPKVADQRVRDIFGDISDDDDDDDDDDDTSSGDDQDDASLASGSQKRSRSASDDDEADTHNTTSKPSRNNNNTVGGFDYATQDGQEMTRTDSDDPFCTLFLQMELCKSENLQNLIDEGKLKNREDVMYHVLRQLLSVIQFVHARGVIHRDLKPANVLFDSTSTDLLCDIKVADFGLARNLVDAGVETIPTKRRGPGNGGGEANDRMTSGLGTFLYGAPEQVTFGDEGAYGGGLYGAKVDEYSVGIIWFEMWASVLTSLDYRERRDAILALRKSAKVPDWLATTQPIAARIISTLVHHDPKVRASADDVLALPDLPGDPPDVTAALDAISNHRDKFADRVMQRLLATAKAPKSSPPIVIAPAETMAMSRLFDRAATLRNAASIDAHLEVVPYAHLSADVLESHGQEWVINRRGDPVVLLRDSVLSVGAWFARRARSLNEIGAATCFRGSCIYAHDPDSVEGAFAIYGTSLAPGLKFAEATAFACSFFRSAPPTRGGYAIRIYHPAIAAAAEDVGVFTKSVGKGLPLGKHHQHSVQQHDTNHHHHHDVAATADGGNGDEERFETAVPLSSQPTWRELLNAPVRVATIAEWQVVHAAATQILNGRSAAARAALDELCDAVTAVLSTQHPGDLPVEVFPFGYRAGFAAAGSGSSRALRTPHVTAQILRFHDDALAAATEPRQVAAPAAAAAAPPHNKKKEAKAAAVGFSPGLARQFDVVGSIVCDPLTGGPAAAAGGPGASSGAATTGATNGRLVVLAVNLTQIARRAKEISPSVGCSVAVVRSGHDGARGHANALAAKPEEAFRTLVAAKACWAAGVRADAVYRVERSEESAAAAVATKHGVSHLLALLTHDTHRLSRAGMSAKEISKIEPHAHSTVTETVVDGLATIGGAGNGACNNAALSSTLSGSMLQPRCLEDCETSITVDFICGTPPQAQSDVRRRAFSTFLHYAKYFVPRRIVVVQDADAKAVRLAIADFISYVPGGTNTSPSTAPQLPPTLMHKGLLDWLRHHAPQLMSLAVYNADTDAMDLVLNHRQLNPTGTGSWHNDHRKGGGKSHEKRRKER